MARMYRASTASRVSRGLAVKSSAQSAETRLTLTLVCLVAMFLVLVTPSELINLFFFAATPSEGELLQRAIVVTNVMQTANFSFNFVLYLAVNAQFRGTVAEACRCPAGLIACCGPLPSVSAAMTLETMLPTAAPPPSPAAAYPEAAKAVAVEVETAVVTPTRQGRSEETVGAIDVHVVEHRVMLVRRGDRDYDDDGEHPVDEC